MAKPKKLSRKLGIILVTIFGLGNIVGAGIYALIGKVAGEAGVATPIAFLAAMLIAALSGLSFAELASRLPYSEGTTAYVHAAFNKKYVSVAVGVIMAVTIVVSTATLARAFGGYLNQATGLAIPIGAGLIIILFGFLVTLGIEESTKISALHTIIEILGLLVIIWLGRGSIGHYGQGLNVSADVHTVGITGIVAGIFLAFYAFIGVEDMVHLAEETKNARRTIPIAIIIALGLATILYVLISIVTISSVPINELNQSNAPLTLVFNQISHFPGWVITIVALTAAAGGVLAHIISGSRLLYGMSERNLISKKLSLVSSRRHSPLIAIFVIVLASLLLAAIIEITVLATITSFLVLFIFGLVNLSLLVIKFKKTATTQKYFRVPTVIPALGLISSALLIVFQIIASI